MERLSAKPEWRDPALLALCVWAVYAGVGSNGFHYDDFHSIVDNFHIRNLGNAFAFLVDPTLFSAETGSAMYRPLVLLSSAFNYALAEQNPQLYHLVNLGLHLACVWLVYLLGQCWSGQGLVAAMVFALHPINSEVVNYVSARSESLCAVFFLAGFLAYIKGRQGHWLWQLAAVAGFVASLLSKSVGLALLAVLAAYEMSYNPSFGSALRALIKRQWPFWLVGTAYLGMVGRLAAAALVEEPVRSYSVQFYTQVKALGYYLKLVAVPWGLNVEHQFNPADRLDAPVVLSGILVVGITFLAWRGRHSPTRPLFWLIWAAAALGPTLVVPLNVLVNEHRLYLPTAAFALWLGGVLGGVRPGGRGAIFALLLVLVVWGLLGVQRTAIWRDSRTLWTDAAAKAPLMPRPQIYLADFLKRDGRYLEALEQYRRALKINPALLTGRDQLIVYNNMGATYLRMGRNLDAIAAYSHALTIDSTYTAAREAREGLIALERSGGPAATALQRQGLLFLVDGKLEAAEQTLRQALELHPAPQTWLALAMVHQRLGNTEKARQIYQTLVQIKGQTGLVRTAAERLRHLGTGRKGG